MGKDRTLEIIKTEIERLKKVAHLNQLEYFKIGNSVLADSYSGGEAMACEILSFLSTLESEKPMDLEDEISRTYHDGSVADTSDLDHVSYENIARHFAEWGYLRAAEKYDEIEYNRQRAEESVPKDLEEAAEEHANKHYSEWDESWDDYNGHNVEPENDKLELMDAFIAGAKWMSIHGNDIKEL